MMEERDKTTMTIQMAMLVVAVKGIMSELLLEFTMIRLRKRIRIR